MSRIKDLTGIRFGFWTVQSFSGLDKKFRSRWTVRCDCGTTKEISSKPLQDGRSKSCGCGLNKVAVRPIRHGHFVNGKQSPEYVAWAAMLGRVRNPKNNRFRYYGGRGIKVCERWNDFSNFLSDMGLKPTPRHSIERRDWNGDYEPSNCHWATLQEQNWNKSNNIRIEVDGEVKSVRQCESDYGVRATLIRARLHEGWSGERAAKTPQRR